MEGQMKKNHFIYLSVLILIIAGIHCSKGSSPLSSQTPEVQSGNVSAGISTAGLMEDNELKLNIDPDSWAKGWENSEGRVTAKITGEGFDDIDPDSIEMTNPEGGVIVITPFASHTGGNYFKAKFYKKDAITLIPELNRGEKHEIQITGNFKEGGSFELFDNIWIGNKGNTEISVKVIPKNWNLTWKEKKKGGDVIAKFKGVGFENIVQGSVVMTGSAGPISPYEFIKEISYLKAKFKQEDALTLFPEAKKGDSEIVHVLGDLEGGDSFDFEQKIKFKGKKKD